MSANARSRSPSQICSSRSPGVSISSAPFLSALSCRWRVVCRPRPSRRSSAVGISSRPASRFSSVDLPTPDDPSRTIVRAGVRYASSASTPSPVTLLSACTGTPIATASAASIVSGSSFRSSFVSTTTGSAPLSQAVARYRSSRRTLKSPSSPETMKIVSTFATRTCSSAFSQGVLRETFVRRGSTASIA